MPLDDQDLQKIERAIERQLQPMRTKLDKIYKIMAPDADDVAKMVTVGIHGSKDSDGVPADGHGLLIRCLGSEVQQQKPLLFFLSAAHVIVDHCDPSDPPGPKGTVRLVWSSGEEGAAASREFRVKKIFLDERYILDGSRDIGAVLVEPINCTLEDFGVRTVRCCSPRVMKTGQLAVGHGLVYLSGRIILEEVIKNTPRVTINAISVPGCSGCPMFTHDEAAVDGVSESAALYCFLHGMSKHRHSRVSVLGEASSHLFADRLHVGELKLRPVVVKATVHEALREAEFLEGDESISENFELLDQNCPKIITDIAGTLEIPFKRKQKFSINSIMKVLADAAFEDGSLVLGDDPENLVLDCMVLSSGDSKRKSLPTASAVTPGKE